MEGSGGSGGVSWGGEGGEEQGVDVRKVLEPNLSSGDPSDFLSPEYKPLSGKKDGCELFREAIFFFLSLDVQKCWKGIFG